MSVGGWLTGVDSIRFHAPSVGGGVMVGSVASALGKLATARMTRLFRETALPAEQLMKVLPPLSTAPLPLAEIAVGVGVTVGGAVMTTCAFPVGTFGPIAITKIATKAA